MNPVRGGGPEFVRQSGIRGHLALWLGRGTLLSPSRLSDGPTFPEEPVFAGDSAATSSVTDRLRRALGCRILGLQRDIFDMQNMPEDEARSARQGTLTRTLDATKVLLQPPAARL